MHAKTSTAPLLTGSKTLVVAIFFLLVVLISRCSREKVAPDMNVPTAARDIVHQKYPSAEISKMKVLEHGKVYQLNFRFKGKNYESVVSNSKLLSTAREADEQIPEQLLARLDTLTIRGGKISNYRIVESYHMETPVTEQIADYQLNGQNYVLVSDEFRITLRRYEQASYRTKSIEDLPEKIQQYINARHRPNPDFVNSLTNLNEPSRQHIINNNELTFIDCRVILLTDGSKHYEVTINFLGVTGLVMLFDNAGDLIWVPQFNRIRKFEQDFTGGEYMWVSNLTSGEISYFRDIFAGQSQLFGFNLDSQQNFNSSFRNEYEDFRSYQFDLFNYKGERWILHYNAENALIAYYYTSQ
jgi:hypothetical protein